jgi:hypothetical protein
LSALTSSIFFSKRWWCPDIKNLDPVYAHFECVIGSTYYILVSITWPKHVQYEHKICVWPASRCIQSSPNTSCSRNWAAREKRISQYFGTVYDKDPLLV